MVGKNIKNIMVQTKYWKWVKPFVLPFVKNDDRKKYIFIIGCYNSGTTLLDAILGSHEEVSNLPTEGVALTNQYDGPEMVGWPRLWYKCLSDLEPRKPINSDRLKKEWGFVFDAKYQFYLEKSIVNATRLPWLNTHFDEPYFIWVVRNGYAVAEGIRRRTLRSKYLQQRFRPKGYPMAWCARQWVETNQKIKNDANGVQNIKQIFYEDLTERYEETMETLINWLPLQEKNIPDVKYFKFHGKNRKIDNMNSKSMAQLTGEDVRQINSVAEEELEKYSYRIIKDTP